MFYIGSGKLERAFAKSFRNKAWALESAKGYTVDVIVKDLTKQESLELEEHLISITPNLTNTKKVLTDRIHLDRQHLSEVFKVDPLSPSGLIRIGGNLSNPRVKSMVGKPAGNKKYQTDGRPHAWQLMLNGKSYLVHRIVYTLVHGEIPDDCVIDHVDRNPFNNKIENLRVASYSDNRKNSKPRLKREMKCGIHFWKSDKVTVTYFVASFWKDGKRHQTYFSIPKLGYDGALIAANECLSQHEGRLE